jgi:hypothetical protein
MRIAPQKRPVSFSVSSGGGRQAVWEVRLVYISVSNKGKQAKKLAGLPFLGRPTWQSAQRRIGIPTGGFGTDK